MLVNRGLVHISCSAEARWATESQCEKDFSRDSSNWCKTSLFCAESHSPGS